MKALLLIVGILLAVFGGVVSLGVAIGFIDGTSEYAVGGDIIGLVFLGIGPIVGGLFLSRRALLQRGGSQATASKRAKSALKQE